MLRVLVQEERYVKVHWKMIKVIRMKESERLDFTRKEAESQLKSMKPMKVDKIGRRKLVLYSKTQIELLIDCFKNTKK